ncbi:MBL fold metallo-hydrolase [Paenibacillus taichungensis]|uniref:MBL fold metallo-hydrolase n=1 Tax=Paenibacillus taichungensis TaxID=484184 RepID=UPI00380FC40D
MKKSGVISLELGIELPQGMWTFTPSLLYSEDELILVDTGVAGMVQEVSSKLNEAGYSIEQLTGILLTHQDPDHIGNLIEIIKTYPGKKVYAHAADRPYINGELPLLKQMPPTMQLKTAHFPLVSGTVVTDTLEGGDELAFGGGVIVIETPGHTPGHISLYHPASKTLIAGDAMLIRGGQLQGPNPMQTPDLKQAYESLSKFAAYDIEKILCYHGGWYEEGNVNERIAKIAAAGPQG